MDFCCKLQFRNFHKRFHNDEKGSRNMKDHGINIYIYACTYRITSVGDGLEVVEHLTTFTSRWFIFDTSFSGINLPRLWIY